MAKLAQVALLVVLVVTTVFSRPNNYGVKGGRRLGAVAYQPRGQYVGPAVDQGRQPDSYGRPSAGVPVDQGNQPDTYRRPGAVIPGNEPVTDSSGRNIYVHDDLRTGRGYGQHQSSNTEFQENNQRSRTDRFGSDRNEFSESTRSGTRYGQNQDADSELIGSQHRSRSEDSYGSRNQFRESSRSDTRYGHQNTDSQLLDVQRGTEDLYASRDSTGSLRRENDYVYNQDANTNFAGSTTDDRYATSVGQSRRNYGVKH